MDGSYTGTIGLGGGLTGQLTITGSFVMQGGTLQGGAALNLQGSATFGSMRPGANPLLMTSPVNVQSGVTMNIRGPGNLATTINNSGTVNFQGSGYTVNNPSFNNNGTVDLQGDVSFGGSSQTFNNYKVFQKSGGGGTSTVTGNLSNQAFFYLLSGTVSLVGNDLEQSNPNSSRFAQTELNGGALQVSSPYLVLGGWLDGVGTITGEVDNGDPTGQRAGAGYVHPGLLNAGNLPGSGGLLNITGDYDQTPSGVLWIDVHGPSSGMGRLNVQGVAYLQGEAHVVRDPAYKPGMGEGNLSFLTYGAEENSGLNVTFENNSWTTPDNVTHSFRAQDDDQSSWSLVVQ